MSDIPPEPRHAGALPASTSIDDEVVRRRARLRELGYTMLEVMVAVGIVALIATFAVRAYDRYLDRAKAATAVSDILEISNRIKSFELNNRRLPDSLDEIGRGSVADPWGRAYQYFNLETERGNGQARQRKNLKPLNTDYDLYSIGRDGETSKVVSDDKALDDVVRGLNGRFTGFAKDLDATASSK